MIELNKVLLVGRLTRDPETKYLPSGMAVCDMRVASDRGTGKDAATGEYKKETLFISVTAFGKVAEFAQQYLRKGSGVLIEGRLRYETWKDKTDGRDRDKISITAESIRFGESKAEAEGRRSGGGFGRDGDPMEREPASSPAPQRSAPNYAQREEEPGNTNDDLPF